MTDSSVAEVANMEGGLSTRRRKWAQLKEISNSSLQKIKTRSLVTRKHWGKFCKNTSIHGMRYLTEPNRTWIERVWWVSVVIFGFMTASYYVSRQFVKWSQTAIEADNYDEQEDMMGIPFPAFTICDNRKIHDPNNETVNEEKLENLLYMLCGDDRIKDCNYTIEDFIQWSYPLIFECILVLDDKILDVMLTSDCESMIVKTFTDQGVCFTFNMFDPTQIFKDNVLMPHGKHGRRSEWNLLSGYNSTAKIMDTNHSVSLQSGSFPKRAKHAVHVNIYHENTTKPTYCDGKSDGFKVILHSPHEIPMVGFRESPWTPLQVDGVAADKYIDIPAHGTILIDVRARKIVPSKNLDIYSSRQRRCYYPGEKELAFFKQYSFNNCHLECLTNHTLKFCDCKDFYMPTWESVNETLICSGAHRMRCLLHAFDYWDKNREDCKCLPTCTTLLYDTKTWHNNRPLGNKREDEGLILTKLVVYSTDHNYVKSERRAVYTLVDFIADCGGVFGLFCGMSIISLLEFVYYSLLWILENKTKK